MPSLRNTLLTAAALAMTTAGGIALAANPMVGGAAMYANRTIVANAMNSRDHTTLVSAVKAAGLVDTLSGTGPYTVFAPTNAAFAKLPAAAVADLMKPENKMMLTGVLTYHVVPGRITAEMIAANARAHGGRATYKTVQGETLTFMQSGRGWAITDAKGGHAMITTANVMQSNGVIHVIDTVLMP